MEDPLDNELVYERQLCCQRQLYSFALAADDDADGEDDNDCMRSSDSGSESDSEVEVIEQIGNDTNGEDDAPEGSAESHCRVGDRRRLWVRSKASFPVLCKSDRVDAYQSPPHEYPGSRWCILVKYDTKRLRL